MMRFREVLSALFAVTMFVASARAQNEGDASAGAASSANGSMSTPANSPASASANSPRLDAVFKSLQDSTQGKGVELPLLPIAIVAAAGVLMTVAIKQWHRRRASPRPLSNHRKLLVEASRAAGISTRKLKRIAPLAAADGLSSPLVAIICPSAIKRLAGVVKTADEQEALKSMAQTLFRAEGVTHNLKQV